MNERLKKIYDRYWQSVGFVILSMLTVIGKINFKVVDLSEIFRTTEIFLKIFNVISNVSGLITLTLSIILLIKEKKCGVAS